jgi:hypothetical protein
MCTRGFGCVGTNGRCWLRVFAMLAIVSSAVAGASGDDTGTRSAVHSEETTEMAERVVLDGVDRYRVVEPLFEGVRVVLAYRAERYSPAYVQGISGAAFRIAGPCPCAPTCSSAMSPEELARLLGYEVERIDIGGPYDPQRSCEDDEAARRSRMEAALERIKAEIRAGRPALLVQAFTTWEYDVVCGFDEGKHELYGRGSYAGRDGYAREDEMRALGATAIGGGPYALLIGEKTRRFDARTAELSALREAVAHAHSGRSDLPEGLACYDLWINRYGQKRGFAVPDELPPDGYPLGILPTTRSAASEFMLELAAKYPSAKANLEMASEHFGLEAKALASARDLRTAIDGDASDDQSVRMAGLLSQARAMYALAIDEIARAAHKIEAKAAHASD